MCDTYTNAELRDIAEELVEELRELDDGTAISTWKLLQTSGYDEEDACKMDLIYLHDYLAKAAKRNHIILDMPMNVGEVEGRPHELEYIVYNKRAQIKCPYCGSINTARIIYGYPLYTEEMERKLHDGKWTLGGCVINSYEIDGGRVSTDPRRECNDCKKRFATNPVLVAPKKGIAEDYRDIVTCISFELEEYRNPGQGTRIEIRRNNKGALVKVCHLFMEQEYQISETRWYKILDKLYCDMYLHEWKKKYDTKGLGYVVMDGEHWTLDVTFTGRRKRTYRGDNAYPPYWKEMLRLFGSFSK